MEETSLAERVVQAFGGLTKASAALETPLTTIDSWRRSRRIPTWRLRVIREAAERRGVTLPDDFPKEPEAERQGAERAEDAA